MAEYIRRIKTADGDKQIDYTALANLPQRYNGTGQNEDGWMTQKAVTDCLTDVANAIIGAARGEAITIADSTNYPLKGLNIYGKSTQDGEPSPDSPVEIVNVGAAGSIGAKLIGKNIVSDLTYLASGSDYASLVKSADTGAVKKGEIYTISVTLTAAAQTKAYWNNVSGLFELEAIEVSAGTNRYSKTFTALADGDTGTTKIFLSKTATGDGMVIQASECQIERGAEATNYEPYTAKTITVQTPNGLPGIPVASGGTYTDGNGQMWICDEVDLTRGVYIQRIATLDLSTLSGWTRGTGNGWANASAFYAANALPDAVIIDGYGTIANILCNRLAVGKPSKIAGQMVNQIGQGTGISLFVSIEGIETAEGLSAYLDQNRTIVLYPLAEALESALTDAEIAAYKALHTNYPSTTILNDAGAYMSVEYVADTKTYVDNLTDGTGTIISPNADYAEVGEWADGNPDGENRLGYFVAIDTTGDKLMMRKATSADDVRGVTVVNPAFSGNATKEKYSAPGTLLPQYDYVGLMGIIPVIDNGTCEVHGRCMPADDGTAIPSSNNMGYSVLERVDDTHVLIAVEPGADMVQRIKTDIDEITGTAAPAAKVPLVRFDLTRNMLDVSGDMFLPDGTPWNFIRNPIDADDRPNLFTTTEQVYSMYDSLVEKYPHLWTRFDAVALAGIDYPEYARGICTSKNRFDRTQVCSKFLRDATSVDVWMQDPHIDILTGDYGAKSSVSHRIKAENLSKMLWIPAGKYIFSYTLVSGESIMRVFQADLSDFEENSYGAIQKTSKSLSKTAGARVHDSFSMDKGGFVSFRKTTSGKAMKITDVQLEAITDEQYNAIKSGQLTEEAVATEYAECNKFELSNWFDRDNVYYDYIHKKVVGTEIVDGKETPVYATHTGSVIDITPIVATHADIFTGETGASTSGVTHPVQVKKLSKMLWLPAGQYTMSYTVDNIPESLNASGANVAYGVIRVVHAKNDSSGNLIEVQDSNGRDCYEVEILKSAGKSISRTYSAEEKGQKEDADGKRIFGARVFDTFELKFDGYVSLRRTTAYPMQISKVQIAPGIPNNFDALCAMTQAEREANSEFKKYTDYTPYGVAAYKYRLNENGECVEWLSSDEQGDDLYTYWYKPIPAYRTYMYKFSFTNESMLAAEGKVHCKKKILLTSGVHGDEKAAPYNSYLFAKRLCELCEEDDYYRFAQAFDVYIIPCVNGYGQYHNTRWNANGININRNFDSGYWAPPSDATGGITPTPGTIQYPGVTASSEFEAKLISKVTEEINPDMACDLHNYTSSKRWQFYPAVCKREWAPLMYQSCTDCSLAFKRKYPEHFGNNIEFARDATEDAVECECKNGSLVAWWYYRGGVFFPALIEISQTINYINGESVYTYTLDSDGNKVYKYEDYVEVIVDGKTTIMPRSQYTGEDKDSLPSVKEGFDRFGHKAFSVNEYTLRNQLMRYGQFVLENKV